MLMEGILQRSPMGGVERSFENGIGFSPTWYRDRRLIFYPTLRQGLVWGLFFCLGRRSQQRACLRSRLSHRDRIGVVD